MIPNRVRRGVAICRKYPIAGERDRCRPLLELPHEELRDVLDYLRDLLKTATKIGGRPVVGEAFFALARTLEQAVKPPFEPPFEPDENRWPRCSE